MNIVKHVIEMMIMSFILVSLGFCVFCGHSLASGQDNELKRDPNNFLRMEALYNDPEYKEKRADLLVWMHRDDMTASYLYVYSALLDEEALLLQYAADLIGNYYVIYNVYADDHVLAELELPQDIISNRINVIKRLQMLAKPENTNIFIKLNSIQSLLRMGETNEAIIAELCDIACGHNMTNWRYFESCVISRDGWSADDEARKNAIGLLIHLEETTFYKEQVGQCLDKIKNEINKDSELYRRVRKALSLGTEDEIDSEEDERNTEAADAESWNGYASMYYAKGYCNSRNSINALMCDPFKDYSSYGGDCANFASQCLYTGGINISWSSNYDNCKSEECCIINCDDLDGYLQGRYEIANVVFVDYSLENDPQSNIPFGFGEGDIAILGTPDDPYKHAIINSGGSASLASFSAHSTDRCDVSLNFFVPAWCPYVTFYEITGPTSVSESSWGAIKSLFGESYYSSSSYAFSNVNNELVWEKFDNENTDTYQILRSENNEDFFTIIGIQAGNDTTFVDTTTVAGNTYQYRIISAVGDTLYYTDEQRAALKEVVTLEFPARFEIFRNNMVFTNDILILAYEAPNGEQILSKIDLNDVYNPDILTEKHISNNYALKDMGIVHNNEYLACLFSGLDVYQDYLGIYDISKGATLPCVAWVPVGTLGGNCQGYMYIKENMIYIPTANEGIYTFNLNNPDNPNVWGQYLAPSELEAERYNLVITGEYLNIWYFSNAHWTWVQAQLLPIVNEVQHTVYFQEVCSSVSENPCYEGREIQYYTWAPVKGDYFLGWYTDIPLEERRTTLFSASDPLSPLPLITFERNDLEYYRWSDYDDQYLYRCGDGSTYERDIRAHDMFDQDVLPPMPEKHQAGELVAIGSFPRWSEAQQDYIYVDAPEYIRWASNLISYGKYLFYSDFVSWENSLDEQNVQTLRIFEKHRGCDPQSMAATVSMEPIASTYELDQYMIISWAVDGCPMRIDIILRESGDSETSYQTIASIDKFNDPSLAQGSIEWYVESIHEDIDNYSYQLLVRAWNLEGYSITEGSYSFTIVEEFPDNKPGKKPVIDFGGSTADNADYRFPLDKLKATDATATDVHYLVLPPEPFAGNGVSFTISCPAGINLNLGSLSLHVIDYPRRDARTQEVEERYESALVDAIEGCAISIDEKNIITKKDCAIEQSERIVGCESQIRMKNIYNIDIVDARSSGGINVISGEKQLFECDLPYREQDLHRSYVLGYSGYLEETDEAFQGDSPKAYALNAVFPNPFNPNTSIEFHVPHGSNIRLSIFDINGRLIRGLVNERFEPGVYTITWDGKNNSGNHVSSGVYFSTMIINGSEKITKKLILIR